MADRKVSFWGITDSLKYGRHLQSYFLVFERGAAQSAVFREFWQKLPDYRHKYAVIIQGEVGLTRKLVAAGFDFAAYCPVEAIQQNLQNMKGLAAKFQDPRISPMHKGWQHLLQSGCPFLKVQLLRDNPMQVPDLGEWQAALAAASDYNAGLIRNHQARMKNLKACTPV
jgi:rhamnosyltransferase